MNVLQNMISEQLVSMEARIRPSNKQGDVDGLFAHFILEGTQIGKWKWEVSCADNAWIQDHASGLSRGNPSLLAALGFSLAIPSVCKQEGWFITYLKGIEVLQKRELFPSDGVSFPNIPKLFLGLTLGAKSIPDLSKRNVVLTWLLGVLDQLMTRKSVRSPALIYEVISNVLTNTAIRIDRKNISSILELSLLNWGINNNTFEIRSSQTEMAEMREQLVTEILSMDAQNLDSTQATLLWYGLYKSLTQSVHEQMLSSSHVSIILNRFQDAMRRWRWDSDKISRPVRWAIRDEREVQDIVWIMLKPVFSDIVDEDTLPKFGHSSYKADFGMPSLSLLIEVKFARKAEDFKVIEKGIMEDSIGYLIQTERYKKILVFIYDDSASVQEHGVTKEALKKLSEIEDIIIVSRPSHLPTGSTS